MVQAFYEVSSCPVQSADGGLARCCCLCGPVLTWVTSYPTRRAPPPTFNMFSRVSSLNKGTKTRRFHFLLCLVYHVPYVSINVYVCNIIYASCSGAVDFECDHFRFPVLNGPLELPPVVIASVGTRLMKQSGFGLPHSDSREGWSCTCIQVFDRVRLSRPTHRCSDHRCAGPYRPNHSAPLGIRGCLIGYKHVPDPS